MLDAGIRTCLIDEADRSLAADKDGVGELLAVLNSGYKRGATRPVLVPTKNDGWQAKEMPTFSPVVMAGNNPNLPDDTRSRSIRVLLMPDINGEAEESDWEVLDEDALELGLRLATWADCVRDQVRSTRPDLPEGIRGRARERWAPLKRVAAAAGGHWPDVVDELSRRDLQRIEAERDEGLVQQKPAIVLLQHIHHVWVDGETFVPTEELIDRLVAEYPEMWGSESPYGKRLTAQRLGRMLVSAYNLHSDRPNVPGPRGYLRLTLTSAFRRLGLDHSGEPVEPVEPVEPEAAGISLPHSAPERPAFYTLYDATPDAPPDTCPDCGWPWESIGHEDTCIKVAS
jgi:hypothetical protein